MKKQYNGNSKKGGVYQIKNVVNGKVYIGSTKCFQVRTWQHCSSLRTQSHHCKKLQNSWNKYGDGAFLFEVLEVVEGDRLARTTKEQKYINQYLDKWEMCLNDKPKAVQKQGPWSLTPERTREKLKTQVSIDERKFY